VTSPNGQSKQITYEAMPEKGKAFSFDGVMFVYAGAAKCR